MSISLKQLVLTTLLLFPIIAMAQTDKIEVNGIILDETNNPVPYVAVGIVKKHMGTASTEDGEFSFLVTKNELQDTLSISSLGYDPFKIKVADYLKQGKKEIVLKETITELDEVKILKPGEYVENALDLLKDNTISKPYQIEMLYRRAATENGKSKFFVENYIKIRDRGPAYPLGLVQVTEARKSADYRIWKRKQWTHSLTWMATANPLRPTEKQPNLKRFIWKKIGDSSYEGEDVVIIRGKNPKSHRTVTFYIGVDNYAIYRIEKEKALFLYKKHQDGRLYLSYYSNEWGFGKNQVPREFWGTEAEKMTYRLEAFVYNIETDKKKIRVVPYGGDTDMGSLELPYHPDFWSNLSMPPDTKFFKRIKSELESNYGVSLENQFKFVNK
ncbi:carboxypeptidase-like regulatory domain-containing protein [Seonamhaeicola sp.]|uniref:carboxypeptidase-like regulatory domain-containing protein n=1 Tax=Seonamhaeicola sp. TaxID=1912245 RepID=UPI0026194626|nr:carboxypeptidase-like regulatory domain-containing protein [Seonamhaeicola sp.]